MTLDDYIALLRSADAQIDRANALLLTEAADDLRGYAQTIAHKQTGHMAASMHRLGPFPKGAGVLEAVIESGAWYAEDEVSRGGEHDWASRTVDEQLARVQQLADQIENAVVRILTGGAL